MKTQNTKLNFRKDSVIELNDNYLNDINGGGTPLIISFVEASSAPCGAAAGSIVMAVLDAVNFTTL